MLLHWKSAPHCVARGAKRGKKATPAHRDQKEKGVTRVPKAYRGRKEKEATPEARVPLVLKVRRDLRGQREKEAFPGNRARQVLKAREAPLAARACPARKVHRDLQGQKGIPADPTRLQQLEDHISDRKSTRLRQGRSWSTGRRVG